MRQVSVLELTHLHGTNAPRPLLVINEIRFTDRNRVTLYNQQYTITCHNTKRKRGKGGGRRGADPCEIIVLSRVPLQSQVIQLSLS